MSQHEEEFKKTLEAMGRDALRDQSKWGKPVEDPAEFVREMISSGDAEVGRYGASKLVTRFRLAREAFHRNIRDLALIKQQDKLCQMTEEERGHWIETGEWPERLSAGT